MSPEPRVWAPACRRLQKEQLHTRPRGAFEPGGQEVALCASQAPATHTWVHWVLDLGQ